jgi:hypothetical protein
VADASNSKYEVCKTEIFDKYNNYIDDYQFKQTFHYKVIYNNENDNGMKVFSENYIIETKDKSNVLSHPGTFYVKGTSIIWAYIVTKSIALIYAELKLKLKLLI